MRQDFESKWDDLKIFIQYGIITDEKFAEKATDFMLLKNTTGKYFTLKEYEALIKEHQTDKNGTVVYLYTDSVEGKHSFIQGAIGKGYDVLLMDGQLDGHFINWFEHKNQGSRMVRVDSDIIEKLIQKEGQQTMALSSENQDILRPVFESQLPVDEKIHYNIEFEAMDASEAPVVIIQNEYMRRMKEMAAMGSGGMSQFYGQMPDNFTIAVNGNHPLVIDILGEAEKSYGDKLKTVNKKIGAAQSELNSYREVVKNKKESELTDEEKKTGEELENKLSSLKEERSAKLREIGSKNDLVKQLIDLALLSNGMLKGESLTSFIRRSVELIGK